MIFVVFGNVPISFERLAKKIDEIAGKSNEDFIAQSGYTKFPFRHIRATNFFTYSAMWDNIIKADLIITHGGYGTICDALKKNKKIIAVPRIKGEHNHSQVELVEALEKAENVLAVYNIEELETKIAAAKNFKPSPFQRGNAKEIINQFIFNSFFHEINHSKQ